MFFPSNFPVFSFGCFKLYKVQRGEPVSEKSEKGIESMMVRTLLFLILQILQTTTVLYHINTVDGVFINSHSYKMIWRRDISVLKLLWEQSRFTELKWGVTYILASSMMLIQHGSSGQLSATFSASPSNWRPSTPPDTGGLRNWSQKSKQGQSHIGLLYVRWEACDKSNQSFPYTQRSIWHCVWFGLDFSAVILYPPWEGLPWH